MKKEPKLRNFMEEIYKGDHEFFDKIEFDEMFSLERADDTRSAHALVMNTARTI